MSGDMDFAVAFARYVGRYVMDLRTHKRLSQADVTAVRVDITRRFIDALRRREGNQVSIFGEGYSVGSVGAPRAWLIDVVDDPVSYTQGTGCVGVALLAHGSPVLSVAMNPFRSELFTVVAGKPTHLNGRIVTAYSGAWRRNMPYDYCYWDDAPYDLRGLERTLGRPRSVRSALYQACMVATHNTAFAAFPGSANHRIVPGALLAAGAAARVTDLQGLPLDWTGFNEGVLYAGRRVQEGALRLLAAL